MIYRGKVVREWKNGGQRREGRQGKDAVLGEVLQREVATCSCRGARDDIYIYISILTGVKEARAFTFS